MATTYIASRGAHKVTVPKDILQVPESKISRDEKKSALEVLCKQISRLLEIGTLKVELEDGEKEQIEKVVQSTRDWLDKNPDASKDDLQAKMKALSDATTNKADAKRILQSFCDVTKKGLEGPDCKYDEDEQEHVGAALQDALDWMEDNQGAGKDAIEAQLNKLQASVNPTVMAHGLRKQCEDIKNALNTKTVALKLEPGDAGKVDKIVQQTLDWVDKLDKKKLPGAPAFEEKVRELQVSVNPILFAAFKRLGLVRSGKTCYHPDDPNESWFEPDVEAFQQSKIMIDENTGVAMYELNAAATKESLESALQMLHTWRSAGSLQVLVLHIKGVSHGSEYICKLIRNGAFFEGLRAVGVPIVAAVTGHIEGPAWGLVLNSDYRIAASRATFACPAWGSPAGLMDLLGQEPSKAIVLKVGNITAMTAMDMGVIHTTRPKLDEVQAEAIAMAKRMAKTTFPHLIRKKLVGPPDAEKKSLGISRSMNMTGPSL